MAAHIEQLLHQYGYAAIFVVIALENAGLPLPGETILVTSAIFAAETHELNIIAIVAVALAACIAGSVGGFAIGRWGEHRFLHKVGPHIHLTEADLRLGHYLFVRYGAAVVLVARYVAILRSLASILAGANRMDARRFVIFTSLGAAAWAATYGVGAYALGKELTELSARAAVPLVGLVLLLVVAGIWFVHHNRARLQREADRAMS